MAVGLSVGQCPETGGRLGAAIGVLVVDDDPLVRSGLRFMLESTDDLQVVGEAADGLDAVAAAADRKPDVVLMDLRMPRLDGIEATRRLRSDPAGPQVIALTTWEVDDALLAVLAAGASGFLLKTSSPEQIMSAVRSVVAGDAVLSPGSTRVVLDRLVRDRGQPETADGARPLDVLTERELEVVIAVGHGLTNAEIGARLYVSDATVKSHIQAILLKSGARNRVDLAVLAERAGLLQP